jgi:hypothetical protein
MLWRPRKLRHRSPGGVAQAASKPPRCCYVPGSYSISGTPVLHPAPAPAPENQPSRSNSAAVHRD